MNDKEIEQQINDIIVSYLNKILIKIDGWSVQALEKFLVSFYQDYSILCEKKLYEKSIDFHEVRDLLISGLKKVKHKKPMLDYVQEWNFKSKIVDVKNFKEHSLENDPHYQRTINLTSELLNYSYENQESFEGIIKHPQKNKDRKIVGYYVRNSEDDALAFCFATNLPKNIKIGYADNFIAIKKDRNNFVVEPLKRTVLDVSDEFIVQNLHEGQSCDGVVIYIADSYMLIQLSINGREMKSMLHKSRMNPGLRENFKTKLFKGAKISCEIDSIERSLNDPPKINLKA